MLFRLTVLLGALVAFVLAPGAASAHAQLRGADPPANAVLAAAPAEVRLTFNEPVGLLTARWFGPDGAPVTVAARAEGAALIVIPPAAPAMGTHALSWRIASADGHPVGGVHLFAIGAPSAAPTVAVSSWQAGVAAAARFVLTAALVFGVGGLLWSGLSGVPAGRGERLAALLVLPAALVFAAAQTLDLTGAGPDALASPAAWRLFAHSPYFAAVVLSGAAALAALAAAGQAPVLLGAWVVAALSFAVAGHAATAPPWPIPAIAIAVHAAALIFWLGALPPLARALRRGIDSDLLQRFSRLATPLVAALVVSGLVLAQIQLGDLQAAAASRYGQVLAAKLGLVAMLLGLAAVNRLVLTPALARGERPAIDGLRRSVAAELVLGVLILALAAAFRLTPPPRVAAGPLDLHLHGEAAMADLSVAPARPGPNRFTAAISAADGGPLRPLEVRFILNHPKAGLGPIEAAAQRGADGRWSGELHLSTGGQWEVIVDVLITDFRKEALGADLTLRDE